jgi:NitT/TauT family transport system substrate-binding protein
LEVESIKFESTNQLTDALIAGRIDAGLGGINTFLLFTIEEKTPGYFKIFSLSTEDALHPSTAIVVANSSTLKISDLNNKKIAAYLGSGIKMMYDRFVKVNNLQNTTLMQMDPNLELPALQAGQVSAAFLLEPQVTVGSFKKISQPLELGLFDKYYVKDIPFSASVVSQTFTNEHPEAVKQLVKASDECVDIIQNNPDELRKILPVYTTTNQEIAPQLMIAPFKKYNEINKTKLQELSNLLLELGEIKNPVNAETMILPDKYVKDN